LDPYSGADIQTQLRERNLSKILRCFKENTPTSRAQLAELTGLNKSTVSSLVEELIDLGLVSEIGLDTSGRGRHARLLELNPQAEHAIGVELGVGFVRVILSDFTGHIIWQGLCETTVDKQPQTTIDKALELVDQAQLISRSYGNCLRGLGVATPGMVDVENGLLLFSPGLQWRDIALASIFRDRTGLSVSVENNAHAAAIGEQFFGVAQRARNFVFILVGRSVSGGLFLNGNIYRGAGGSAGRLGHANFMESGNYPCRCGDRGCWETSAGQSSLLNRAQALLAIGETSLLPQLLTAEDSPLTLSIILKAAAAGDKVALEALAETGTAIGIGIANLINILNPELIVIGGNMSVAGAYLLPAINQVVKKHSLAEAARQTRIVLSKFDSDAIAIGAATLIIKTFLFNPRDVKR